MNKTENIEEERKKERKNIRSEFEEAMKARNVSPTV